MKKYLLLILPLILTGCLEKKDLSFFAEDGITVGKIESKANGNFFIPIKFKTKILHSAKWLYDVEYKQGKTGIYITAVFTKPPGTTKSIYPGGLTIKSPVQEKLKLIYKDANGTEHELREIILKGK
jgi:hypothetical protein